MTGVPGLILLFAAIILSVIISSKLKINIGVVGMFMALIVGIFLKMKPQAVWGFFPTNLFLLLFSTTFFFGFVSQTNVFEGISRRLLYAFRKRGWAIPIVLMVACYAIAVIGAGNYGTPALMSPLAFGLAAELGFNPVLAAVIVWLGSTLSGLYPWESKYLTLNQLYITSIGEEGAHQAMMMLFVVQHILFLLLFFAYYFFTKAYKCKPMENMPKPEPFTKDQKKALIILCCFFALLCIPPILKRYVKWAFIKWMTTYLDIRTLTITFALIFHVAGLGKANEVFTKKIPWSSIFKAVGMCTLAALATEVGIVDTLSGIFQTANLPPILICPLLVICCAALGAVTDGTAVVAPLFIPIAAAMAPLAAITPAMMGACIYAAANCTSISPLSTGGNMATIGASNEQRDAGLYKNQFIYTGIQVVLFIAAGFVSLWALVGKVMGY